MSTLTTRAGKGSSLTNAELDANFNNLNNDKLETSAYTAADVLAKLLTVDGAASGLDADLLDGQSSAYYTDIASRLGYTPLNAASYTAADVLAKLLTVDGHLSNLDADTVDGVQLTGLVQTSRNITTGVGSGLTGGGNLGTDRSLAFDTTWGDARYLLASAYTANDILTKLLTVDGAGSSIDADNLDGQSGAYYADIPARLGYTPVTNARTITAGTGITGGGDLTANRTLTFDTTWGDARYAVAGHTHSFLGLAGGTLTGSLTVKSGATGYIKVTSGDANYPGYIEMYTANDIRRGYVGYGNASNQNLLVASNGWTWRIEGAVEMDSGMSITGLVKTLVNSDTGFEVRASGSSGGWARGLIASKASDSTRMGGAGWLGSAEGLTSYRIGFHADWWSTGHGLTVDTSGNTTTTGDLRANSAAVTAGSGNAGEKRLGFQNAAGSGYFFHSDARSVGYYDATAGIVRFSSDSGGNFAIYNYCSATRFYAGFDAAQNNSFSCSNWFRSSGNTGWYSETHGVGIYSQGSGTVETYNSASLKANVGADNSRPAASFSRNNNTYYGKVLLLETNESGGGDGPQIWWHSPNVAYWGCGVGAYDSSDFVFYAGGSNATFGTARFNIQYGGGVRADSFQPYSSREVKDNIVPVRGGALSRVMAWQMREFTYKDDESKRLRIGLIAEDADDRIAAYSSKGKKDGLDMMNMLSELTTAFQEYVRSHP